MCPGEAEVQAISGYWGPSDHGLDGIAGPFYQCYPTPWTRCKGAGNHLTPFWLYARMQMSCPTKSQVQFGCTSFARSPNPRTHAYARGKGEHLSAAVRLLQNFIDQVWAFEEQPQGDAEPTHAHQHDTWEEKQMRQKKAHSSSFRERRPHVLEVGIDTISSKQRRYSS